MSQTIVCPCCNGSGAIEEKPVTEKLSPMQQRIWETVRRCNGITGRDLVDLVYADRIDGGPVNALKSVHVTIFKLNKRLLSAGQQIRGSGGRGSVYRLQRDAK